MARLGSCAIEAGALALSLGVLACGGGGSGSRSPEGGVTTAPPDGGAAPDGGSAAPDGGAAAPDAGTAGGGTGSGGTGGPAPDGGPAAPTGGGASAPCDGLVPTLGAPVDVGFDTGTHSDCFGATSHPSGQVALGFSGAAGVVMDLFTAAGASQSASLGGVQVQGQDIDPWFHPTGSGYQGIVHDPGVQPPLELRSWSGGGGVISDGRLLAVSSAADGQGGSVLVGHQFDATATPSLGAPVLAWVDGTGAVVRSVDLDRDAAIVLVSWPTGRVLVATRGASAEARWFDGAGAPLTPWFAVPVALSATSLHLLVDGTVVVNDGGAWDVAFPDGAPGAVSVPGWLAARPGTRLATIRQGGGYAVLPFARGGGPSTAPLSLEVVAATGESCGTVSVPLPATTPGATKSPQRLDVGQDGTLLQWSQVVATGPSGIHCEFQWWSGLLR